MQTVITAKYQTTIPKAIREKLGLSIHDALEWTVDHGKIVVRPVRSGFLRFRNTVHIGAGDIEEDIKKARRSRMERYK